MNGYRGGFGGGFGGANLQNLMRQAQKMQEDMQKAKEELEAKEFTASVGGGMVQVVMTGDKKVIALNIKPAIVDPDDIETLQDLIIAGVNDALEQIKKEEQASVPQIPGM
ncbi:MAG: YbaB/EbfC family nucleoid-associated protein [Clostridiales bacterium]|nr:YbaB/EbfC family nucleoid-associated protein [Clostridiales bacterium]